MTTTTSKTITTTTYCNETKSKHTSQSGKQRSRITYHPSSLVVALVLLLNYSPSHVSSMDLFSVKYVEQGNARLIATSNENYAIASPELATKGWEAVSVNGGEIIIVPVASKLTQKPKVDKGFIESLRDKLSSSNTNSVGGSLSTNGYGSNMMFNSNSNSGFSTSSASFSSSGTNGQGSFMSSGSDGATSVMMKDDNNFSVLKTTFPFNWSRVFVNGDFVTYVYKDGTVKMRRIEHVPKNELEYLNKLKKEVKGMQSANLQQANNMVANTFGSVSSILNGIMSGLPKPPDFSSSMGNIFGNNFPFGNNNSPFGSGFPFAGGAGAFAFAGRR